MGLKGSQSPPERRPEIRILDIQFAREEEHGHRGRRRDLAQLRPDQRLDAFNRNVGLCQRRIPGRGQRFRHMIGHRVPHRGLGRKVPEYGRLRHADLGRHRTRRHPVRPDPVSEAKDRRYDFSLPQIGCLAHDCAPNK